MYSYVIYVIYVIYRFIFYSFSIVTFLGQLKDVSLSRLGHLSHLRIHEGLAQRNGTATGPQRDGTAKHRLRGALEGSCAWDGLGCSGMQWTIHNELARSYCHIRQIIVVCFCFQLPCFKFHVIKVAIAHMLPCSAIYCWVMAAKIQVRQPKPALATALAEDAWHQEVSKYLQILIIAVHVGSVWTRTPRTCLERPKEISEMSMCLSQDKVNLVNLKQTFWHYGTEFLPAKSCPPVSWTFHPTCRFCPRFAASWIVPGQSPIFRTNRNMWQAVWEALVQIGSPRWVGLSTFQPDGVQQWLCTQRTTDITNRHGEVTLKQLLLEVTISKRAISATSCRENLDVKPLTSNRTIVHDTLIPNLFEFTLSIFQCTGFFSSVSHMYPEIGWNLGCCQCCLILLKHVETCWNPEIRSLCWKRVASAGLAVSIGVHCPERDRACYWPRIGWKIDRKLRYWTSKNWRNHETPWIIWKRLYLMPKKSWFPRKIMFANQSFEILGTLGPMAGPATRSLCPQKHPQSLSRSGGHRCHFGCWRCLGGRHCHCRCGRLCDGWCHGCPHRAQHRSWGRWDIDGWSLHRRQKAQEQFGYVWKWGIPPMK